MNKLSIIPIDRAVYIDGKCIHDIDLSFVPADIHALQWENNSGWIERKGQVDELLTVLPGWANQAIKLYMENK